MRNLGGLHHTTVVMRDANRPGRFTTVLLYDGPFRPLCDYFAEQNRSLDWERLHARAVGLLIDFIREAPALGLDLSNRSELFNQFAHALKHGTIAAGNDSSQLWWLPRRYRSVDQLLTAVTQVSDWLVDRHSAEALNPQRNASIAEQIVKWRRWSLLSKNSLLEHLKSNDAGGIFANHTSRFATPTTNMSFEEAPPPAFPEELFVDLLTEGFVFRGRGKGSPPEKHNLRDILVALLLNGGGLRISEAFHLYASDIYPRPGDPSIAYVKVYHPSEGSIDVQTPKGTQRMSRSAYLRLFHDTVPLNQTTKRTGWKNNLLKADGLYMPVHWYPPHYGAVFLKLFERYLRAQRPVSTAPWLFLTEEGGPMTAKAYAQQHQRALERIGVIQRKSDGTSPHGHRHAYGQRLGQAEKKGLISEKIVQLCLHHRSPQSQRVYTETPSSEVTEALTRANQQIAEKDQLSGLGWLR